MTKLLETINYVLIRYANKQFDSLGFNIDSCVKGIKAFIWSDEYILITEEQRELLDKIREWEVITTVKMGDRESESHTNAFLEFLTVGDKKYVSVVDADALVEIEKALQASLLMEEEE